MLDLKLAVPQAWIERLVLALERLAAIAEHHFPIPEAQRPLSQIELERKAREDRRVTQTGDEESWLWQMAEDSVRWSGNPVNSATVRAEYERLEEAGVEEVEY
jgi:hypothetical protein